MMKFLQVTVVLLAIVVFGIQAQKKVVCYYGTWATYRNGNGQCNVDHIDPSLCTHLIYSFVGLGHDYSSIRILDEWLDLPSGRDNMRLFNNLKEKNRNLKTIVAIGGWNEGSYRYSVMANNPTYRAKFVNNAVNFVREYGFDGFDLDWEYPNKRDTAHGTADIQAFTQLTKELKDEFSKYGLLLSAAVSAAESAASTSYDIAEISRYLDFINIMTYDLHGGWDPTVGHNAGLYKSAGQTDNYTVTQSVEYWISKGAPPEKLIMGVPLYARTFRLTTASQIHVGASASGPGIAGQYTYQNGMMGFNEFCEKRQTDSSWDIKWDTSALVPYAVSGNNWVSFDNVQSITEKVNYASSKGLGGIMVWSIETDDFRGVCNPQKFILLRTINNSLHGDGSSVEEEPPIQIPDIPDESVVNPDEDIDDSDESIVNPDEDVDDSDESVASSDEDVSNENPNGDSGVKCTSTTGFLKDPNDCKKFYMCVYLSSGQYLAISFTCPSNLWWDDRINSCNYRDNVVC